MYSFDLVVFKVSFGMFWVLATVACNSKAYKEIWHLGGGVLEEQMQCTFDLVLFKVILESLVIAALVLKWPVYVT